MYDEIKSFFINYNEEDEEKTDYLISEYENAVDSLKLNSSRIFIYTILVVIALLFFRKVFIKRKKRKRRI